MPYTDSHSSPTNKSSTPKIHYILSNPIVGGIEGLLANFITAATQEGRVLQIVNLRSESKAYDLWGSAGIRCHKLWTPGPFLLGSIPALKRFFRREKPDIVEIYGLRANIIGRLAAKMAGIPVVLTGVVGQENWRKWYHALADHLTGWAVDGWIANCQACKDSIVKRERHPEDRIEVIYDGIDIAKWTRTGDPAAREEIRKSLGCAKDTILCVTVANIGPPKGHIYLARAIPKILRKCPDIRFAFVGEDFLEGQIQSTCRKEGVENNVVFTGPRQDIHAIYEAADIAVLPSVYEGLPISLIEAMSMELPVVATRVGGVAELVADGVTGILVPAADPVSLATALIEMAGDPEKRRKMGVAGRGRVKEMFTIERMVENRLRYYDRMMKRKVLATDCTD